MLGYNRKTEAAHVEVSCIESVNRWVINVMSTGHRFGDRREASTQPRKFLLALPF